MKPGIKNAIGCPNDRAGLSAVMSPWIDHKGVGAHSKQFEIGELNRGAAETAMSHEG
jgi:hypothetical protein